MPQPEGDLLAVRRKMVPHQFVLDALEAAAPRVRPMFGCLAVYVQDRIVFCLRHKATVIENNGVWIATSVDHHESLRRDFPSMRSFQIMGKDVTGWQILPMDVPDFEESALRACDLVLKRDLRIGKVPKPKRRAAVPGRSQAQR